MASLPHGDIVLDNGAQVRFVSSTGTLHGATYDLTGSILVSSYSTPAITVQSNGTIGLSVPVDGVGADIVSRQYAADGITANPTQTIVHAVSGLALGSANDLGQVAVTFGLAYAGTGAQPVFHDAQGQALTYTQIQTAYGVTVNWDASSGVLTLSGAGPASVYQDVMHLLTAGGGASLTGASVVTTDLAGNSTASAGLTVTHVMGDDVLIGTDQSNTLDGGTGGGDVLVGKGGDDVLKVGSGSFQLADGGGGFDILELTGSGISLNLDNVRGIEQIKLGVNAGNTLTVSLQDVLQVPDVTPRTLMVTGDSTDTVKLSAADGLVCADGETQTQNGVTYDVWRAASGADVATLLIEQAMQVQQTL
jgi:hypothetical protein